MTLKKLYWFGAFPPSWPSVGDHAQTLAIQKFLNDRFGDYIRVRFNYDQIEDFFQAPVNSEELILINSGGSFGDLYPAIHNRRKAVISRFPNNRIIQLPVSVHYESAAAFEADKIFFADRPNLTILTRTREAAILLKENFGCRVAYFPDFVFYLDPPPKTELKRRGVLFVLRNDLESELKTNMDALVEKFKRPLKLAGRLIRKDAYFVARKKAITISRDITRQAILKRFPGATIRDTQTWDKPINDANRELIIDLTLRYYQNFRLVVTDRFHSLVFAFITRTPALALPTKIKGKTAATNWKDPKPYFESFRARFVENADPAPTGTPTGDGPLRHLILSRRSVRKWTTEPVPTQAIQRLKEAAIWAPTAANTQAVKVFAITKAETIAQLCQLTSPWFKRSFPPSILAFYYDAAKARKCGLRLDDWTARFIYQDTAAATMSAILTAESAGLKTCWASTTPKQAAAVKQLLGVPKTWILTNMLFVGYSRQHVRLESTHQGRPIKRGAVD